MFLLYHAYVYLEFLILACTIYILAPISVDKVLTLYHKYGIDPTYLITGESSMKDFNLDYYVANSTKEQRNDFFDRVLAYLSKLIR